MIKGRERFPQTESENPVGINGKLALIIVDSQPFFRNPPPRTTAQITSGRARREGIGECNPGADFIAGELITFSELKTFA